MRGWYFKCTMEIYSNNSLRESRLWVKKLASGFMSVRLVSNHVSFWCKKCEKILIDSNWDTRRMCTGFVCADVLPYRPSLVYSSSTFFYYITRLFIESIYIKYIQKSTHTREMGLFFIPYVLFHSYAHDKLIVHHIFLTVATDTHTHALQKGHKSTALHFYCPITSITSHDTFFFLSSSSWLSTSLC